MRRGRTRSRDDEAEVNMTPMLDIVFILLIFFIVTANIITFQGKDLMQPPTPDDPPPPNPNQRSITVWVDEENRALVDSLATNPAGVAALVETVRAEKPNANVIFKVHEDADYGVMIRIQDDLQSKGMATKIEIVNAADLQ